MIENAKEYYKKSYGSGYGVVHPEGHIIRVYKQIMEYDFGISGGRVFDFGMGVGQHLKWLTTAGQWEPYGCDIMEEAVNATGAILPEFRNNFFVNSKGEVLSERFNTKFDFILANQVLYYLNDKEIQETLNSFKKMLKPGGFFLATMMSKENFYYGLSNPAEGDFREVNLKGRLSGKTFINFKSQDQMERDFSNFKKIQVGYYDTVIRSDEGSTKHYFYLGQNA